MHTLSHPKLFVSTSLAERLLLRDSISVHVRNVDRFLVDPLVIGPVWPVHPEIAERLRLTSEPILFKDSNPEGIPTAPAKLFTLEQLVEKSFQSYAPLAKD